MPDFERADRIGEFGGHPRSRAVAAMSLSTSESAAA
jgi:hypothetical protein